MRIFVGKMDNQTNYNNLVCEGNTKYFKGLQKDDFVFIRLINHEGSLVRSLWKFDRLDETTGIGHFEKVYDFTPLTVDKFSKLNFFKLDIVLGNRLPMQTGDKGFYPIGISDEKAFNDAIKTKKDFESFISDENHYRKIRYVKDPLNTPKSNQDVQIYKDGNVYKIFNDRESFLSEIVKPNVFKPQRYLDYLKYLNQNKMNANGENKKVKEWLENEGNVGFEMTIRKLWIFFCSSQKFGSHTKKKDFADFSKANIKNEENNDKNVSIPSLDFPRNLIIYGIPGCGKSHKLKYEYLKKFDKDNVERTTFHPDYTNTDFIGQVRPIKENYGIDYKVIPGPFTKALLLAFKNPDKNVALVIEEINRGNAAAIFGDLFQLLDRDDDGNSEYKITNEVISSYLSDNGINKDKIYIPSNLYLFATMNTSDQNVFKLDTAFKRRWEFVRLTNKDTESDLKECDFTVFKIGETEIKWSRFIEIINNKISLNQDIGGDRQIGNFFYSEDKTKTDQENLKRFANKVLEYLYNDVYKFDDKEEIFNISKYHSFDEIYNAFLNGENVFNESLFIISNDEEIKSTPDNDEKE